MAIIGGTKYVAHTEYIKMVDGTTTTLVYQGDYYGDPMHKPPFLYDFKLQGHVRIPYEQMRYLDKSERYFIDESCGLEMYDFALSHPRYFDSQLVRGCHFLRKRRRSWLMHKLGGSKDAWVYAALTVNLLSALLNVSQTWWHW